MIKAVILAGGRGRRIGGDKPLVKFLGKPFIFWVFQALIPLNLPVYISVKTEKQKEKIKKTLISYGIYLKEKNFIKDIYPEIEGPISGIYSAIKKFSPHESLLILGVDQIFVETRLLRYLLTLNYIFPNFVIIFKNKKFLEPFPGIYPCTLKNEFEFFLKNSKKKSLFNLFYFFCTQGIILFLENYCSFNKNNFVNINTLEELKNLENVFARIRQS